MSNQLISIIIPVYNSERFLRICLDSIIAQTYPNWECILVDDGSTDSSGAICEEYAAKDSRFRAIHRRNKGVSVARNAGIRESKGEWIYFCDSDDYVYPEALATLVKDSTNGVDLVCAGYIVVDEKDEIQRTVPAHESEIISREEMLRRLIWSTEYIYQGYLWCKLFKADLIKRNGIQFERGIHFNEDRLFIARYLCRTGGRTWFSTQPVYKYVEKESGAMGSLLKNYNPKFVTDLYAMLLIIDEIKKAGCSKNLVNQWKYSAFTSYQWLVSLMLKFGVSDSWKIFVLRCKLISRIGFRQYMKYTSDSSFASL